MAEPKFRVVCAKCKHQYRVREAVPGRMPRCSSCEGHLVLPGKPALVCPKCNKRARSKGPVPLLKPVLCPNCRTPMRAARAETEEVTLQVDRPEASQLQAGPEAATVVEAGGVQASQAQTPPPEAGDALEPQLQSVESGGLSSTTFGRYEVLGEIARGGMGIVYKVRDPDLRRVVALKVLIAGEGADVESAARFLREARSAGSLKHPNIVTIYEVGEFEGQHYFTMEYIEGTDLGELIESGQAELDSYLSWLIRICGALEEVHRRGVIHRDLKPENIMIDEDGRPLVMDFGLAKDLTSGSILSLSGAVMGTPAYMSPEQAQGRTHEVDHRTDIYSMGVILYEVATGIRPFEGQTVFDTIEAVVKAEAVSPRRIAPGLSPDLETVVLRCMEKAPASRYQTMEELTDELRRLQAKQPVLARPVGVSVRLYRRLRGSRGGTALLAGAAAAVLMAPLVWWLAAGSGPVRSIRKAVHSGDPERAAAALVLLEGLLEAGEVEGVARAEMLALAAQVLGGGSPAAEKTALRILAAQQPPAAVASMVALAENEAVGAERACAALAALGAYRAPRIDNPEGVVDALAALVWDDTREPVQAAAVQALGAVYARGGALQVARAAADEGLPEAVRLAAIHLMGERVTLESPHMRVLLELQGDGSELVRAAAEQALASARTHESILSFYGIQGAGGAALAGAGQVERLNADRNRMIEGLLDAIDEPTPRPEGAKPYASVVRRLAEGDETTRMSAAFDLGALGVAEALPALFQALSDSSAGVRRSAARAIVKVVAQHPQTRLELASVTAQLADADELVRENAAFLLGELEVAEAVGALAKALRGETKSRPRRALTAALARIGGDAALQAVADSLATSRGRDAKACLTALAKFGEAAVPHLIPGLMSTSRKTREAARAALREASGEDYGTDPTAWRRWWSTRSAGQ